MATSATNRPAAEVREDALACFLAERSRLFGLAYRMLGSVAEADDVTQEVWLRFAGAASEGGLERPEAWLTTVTTRLCIDRLRSAQHRREVYVGPWLPEPILTDRDPAHEVELDDTIRMAFLHALERLAPAERAVFLLHEVFATPFAEIARMVDRSEAACRQIASRARQRVRSERPRVEVDERRRSELLDAFLGAVMGGGVEELETLLAEDVVLASDGGPTRRAARHLVTGRRRTARLMHNLAHRTPEGAGIELVEVNGQPGLVVTVGGVPVMLNVFEFDGPLVRRIHSVLSPDKLAAARVAMADPGGDRDSPADVGPPPRIDTRRRVYERDGTRLTGTAPQGGEVARERFLGASGQTGNPPSDT
ncbi:MAG: RNA polymerase sigma factor SigJ [Microthrixaceae bacterium]|nr:RNA polymerase sigma factor SigJ [Microthrixaceae bacterium]